MKQSMNRRVNERTTRSGRLSLNPYCIEDVGLTQAELATARARAVAVVVAHD